MSCNSCSSSNGAPAGCKNNGTCGTDGCNKLTVFDWLENMEPIGEELTSNIFEVRFKNGRKQYYKNSKDLGITVGDLVAVEAERGYDVGFITLKGGLIPIQLKRKKINPTTTEFLSILRNASEKDIEKWENSRNKEENIKKLESNKCYRFFSSLPQGFHRDILNLYTPSKGIGYGSLQSKILRHITEKYGFKDSSLGWNKEYEDDLKVIETSASHSVHYQKKIFSFLKKNLLILLHRKISLLLNFLQLRQ